MSKSRVSQIQKLRTNNKTTWDVVEERDAHKARLLNFSNGNTVEVFWGLNEDMTRDGMIKMKIGDKEAILNAEEVRRMIRWAQLLTPPS